MTAPSLAFCSRIGARLLVVVLLLMCRPTAPVVHTAENPVPLSSVDTEILQLATPAGKVTYLGSVNPGGPDFEPSAPMKQLVERGPAIQPRLLDELADPRVRNEIALVLAEIGDKDALPRLIEFLPTKGRLTRDENFSTMCLLYTLWQLTGMQLGISSKFSPAYTPEFRTQWRAWYEANKDYLYTPPKPTRAAPGCGRDRVAVDFEAKIAGRPTAAYRTEHPWIAFEEIETWRDGPAYERSLTDFCFSVILNLAWKPHGHAPRETIRSLGHVRDPRALAALHAICAMADDSIATYDLMWTLGEKGDPSSIPVLEKIPRPTDATPRPGSNESQRLHAIEWIRLLDKYRQELRGKPFDPEQQWVFVRCLEGPGVEALVASLRNRNLDQYVSSKSWRVAGYVDREPVRACLRQVAGDDSRDERARTLAHGALARLGERDSLDHLKRALGHEHPGVRLAAADGLWALGNRDGFRALLGLLDLRPIESGTEGVRSGNGSLKVTAINGATVEYVRSACALLGEMGDRAAVEPLERLLPLNLNGVLGGGGSGTGWCGRPDAVALARLGDFSGLAVLRASLEKGDRLDVLSSLDGGDYVAIGRKRFIPDLLPMLVHRDDSKRVLAAQAILLLLERGQ